MQFRKKAIIEAVQVTDEWFVEGFKPMAGITIDAVSKIVTMEGIVNGGKCTIGDFIILGAKAYTMHEEQFKALYEEAK